MTVAEAAVTLIEDKTGVTGVITFPPPPPQELKKTASKDMPMTVPCRARFTGNLLMRINNLLRQKQTTPKLPSVQDIQRQIGRSIRALRLERKWTQAIFAERSGLNREHVGETEHGEKRARLPETIRVTALDAFPLLATVYPCRIKIMYGTLVQRFASSIPGSPKPSSRKLR